MKIGFYIHHSTIKAGGIFTYSIGILRLLLNSTEIEKVCLIYSPDIKNEILSLLDHPKIYSLEIDRRKWSVKFSLMLSYFLYDNYLLIKNYFPANTKAEILRRFSFKINPYKRKINREDISLLHVPIQYSPVYSLNIPLIITMHDLQEFHYPEYFSSQERLHRAINNKKSLEESTFIIVSFNHIKTDILKYFNIKDDKVSVCPPPFADNWFTNDIFSDLDNIKKKYSLPDTFILYPAATWRHKNHINLLNALFNLKKKGIHAGLICTGNKTEYFENVLSKKIIELNLQNDVKFLGIIPESDLISLYKLASLVVIPTKYEAGSGPLYEAMRYKAPVICSNVTSLPETMGNNQFTFNSDNPEEISHLIQKVLTDKDFRERNIKNSENRIEFFKKMNFEKAFTDLYRKIISDGITN